MASLPKIAFNSMLRWTQGGREFITYNNMLFARSVRLAYMHTGITNLKLILLSD